nr:plasmid segregation protein ParM domain-containing protein [Arsenophonus nasoniae]
MAQQISNYHGVRKEFRNFISPNSFKRDWSVSFGDSNSSNYTINGECTLSMR